MRGEYNYEKKFSAYCSNGYGSDDSSVSRGLRRRIRGSRHDCGSGSGGLGIAAPILKPIFVDGLGININVLHRMMMVASCGLDSLPHNGFVVTVINGVCGETHKDAYMPVFWLTVVTPLIATAVSIVLFTLFPNLP